MPQPIAQLGPYDTPLTPPEEIQFQAWKAKHAPDDSGVDYDLRGAFKAAAGADDRGHFTDQFKKPNHPSFSVESMYSTPQNQGGQWIERDGQTFFVPSSANLAVHSFEALQEYFKQVDPNVQLVKQTGPTAPMRNNLLMPSQAVAAPIINRLKVK